MKRILLILTLFTLTSCADNWYKPMGEILFRQMPHGSPGYELGWKHGCESGLATQFGNGFYMNFYKWKKDPDISLVNPSLEIVNKIKARYDKELDFDWNNPEEVKKNFSDYKGVFWSAHAFCRHSVFGIQQTAGAGGATDPDLPGGAHFYNPQKWGIGNVWKLDGKGDTRWKANW